MSMGVGGDVLDTGVVDGGSITMGDGDSTSFATGGVSKANE